MCEKLLANPLIEDYEIREAVGVVHVELDQPAHAHVAHAREPERRQRPFHRLALGIEDARLGADEDERPHAAVRAVHALNGSPAMRS